MYKSKKHRKRINKRFSRHRKINKRNKTRKFRGGNKENNEFILVGFMAVPSSAQPIIMYNNISLDRFLTIGPGAQLILPQLYKLKNIRGLDLRSLINKPSNCSFYEEYINPLITRYNNTNRDIIRKVELKYPGLFQRMYITPEEEEAALKEIQEKEKEKQEEETLTSTKNEEIQQIKRTLQEIQRKINGKEEDTEEMKETYAREMEEMEGMIPYIREDAKAAKAKKAEKTARKKYYNTYFQNAS